MQIPTFKSYGNYKSENYGVNSLVFTTPEGTFWFSYKTLVAFQKPGKDVVCIENYWGPTTGKHLNLIESNKSNRVDSDTFHRLYHDQFQAGVI